MELVKIQELAASLISKLNIAVETKKKDIAIHEGAVEGIKLLVEELGKLDIPASAAEAKSE